MEQANVGDRVMYVVPEHRLVPAIVVQTIGLDMVNLVVFATPEEGPEFATGTAPKMRVRGWERTPENEGEQPPTGVWFRPAGPFAPK